MSFSQSGSDITQSGTDTDSSGLNGITGVTTTVVGPVTLYIVASNRIIVTGTWTIDHTSEIVCITSTSLIDSVRINSGGTLQIGKGTASSYGKLETLYGKNTGLILGKDGPGCCADGSLELNSGGTLNIYGGIVNLNAVMEWKSGCTVNITNGIFFNHNTGTPRIRCQEGGSVTIDGLVTYGIQFDWLTDEVFAKFENFSPLNLGMPIENALGTTGVVRTWKKMPDNLGSTNALMNNWHGYKDVKVYNAEVGSLITIVPDSVSASYSHGGRLYQEFEGMSRELDGTMIESARFFIRDNNNEKRATTTTANSINETADHTMYQSTNSSGTIGVQNLLTAMYYRTDTVADITAPNGKEIVDIRGKTKLVTAAVTGSSGQTCTITGTALPVMKKFTKFYIRNSTSNNYQFEVTADGSATSVAVKTVDSAQSPTNETSNSMNFDIRGEDLVDIRVRNMDFHPIIITDYSLKGLETKQLTVTMTDDDNVAVSEATAGAYTGIAISTS